MAAPARSYGTSAGYLVWRPIVRGLLALDPALPSDEQRAQVDRRMAAYGPDWTAAGAPLLAPVVGLAMPDSRLTLVLDPKARAEAAALAAARPRATAGGERAAAVGAGGLPLD